MTWSWSMEIVADAGDRPAHIGWSLHTHRLPALAT
jgi:hypothetical protein